MGNCMQAPVHEAVVVGQQTSKRGTLHTMRPENSEEDSVTTTANKGGPVVGTSFVYAKNTSALEHWEPLRLLGEGSISTVHLVQRRRQRVSISRKERVDQVLAEHDLVVAGQDSCQDQEDWSKGDLYAMKTLLPGHLCKEKIVQEMKNEIFVMSELNHQNIVRVIEGYKRKQEVSYIMECCRGGDLYQAEGTTEQHAKAIVRRILSAVAYMHDKGVVHRDLKMENVLFATPSHKASEVKVIDFGLATNYNASDKKKMTERVGTIYTMAPEVLRGAYDHKCDLWSLGVVTYILLSATKPFWGPKVDIPWTERRAIMMDRILRADYVDMEGDNWDHVSNDAKFFVKSLLQLDPEQRPSAREALESPWMQTQNDTDIENLSLMNHDQKEQRTKRLAVLLVMENASSADILQLQRILHRYDPEETGFIALPDLRKALVETGRFKPSEVDEVLPDLEEDGKQYRVDHCDFITKALEKRATMETERILAVLDKLDSNQTGKICLQKLRKQVAEVMPLHDHSGDCSSSDWTSELFNSMGGDQGGEREVEIEEVLSWFGQKRCDEYRRNSTCNTKGETAIAEQASLSSFVYARTPSGRFLDPSSNQRFYCDEHASRRQRIP